MNISDVLANPRKTAVRKYLSDLLQERYMKHDEFVSRMSHFMSSDSDAHALVKLAVDLYELGYLRCMNDYKSKLGELGMKVSLVSGDSQ